MSRGSPHCGLEGELDGAIVHLVGELSDQIVAQDRAQQMRTNPVPPAAVLVASGDVVNSPEQVAVSARFGHVPPAASEYSVVLFVQVAVVFGSGLQHLLLGDSLAFTLAGQDGRARELPAIDLAVDELEHGHGVDEEVLDAVFQVRRDPRHEDAVGPVLNHEAEVVFPVLAALDERVDRDVLMLVLHEQLAVLPEVRPEVVVLTEVGVLEDQQPVRPLFRGENELPVPVARRREHALGTRRTDEFAEAGEIEGDDTIHNVDTRHFCRPFL